jgi:hypothetical protein
VPHLTTLARPLAPRSGCAVSVSDEVQQHLEPDRRQAGERDAGDECEEVTGADVRSDRAGIASAVNKLRCVVSHRGVPIGEESSPLRVVGQCQRQSASKRGMSRASPACVAV